jgi:hypothetical protein
MAKFNEGKSLDAVLKILEARHGGTRSGLIRDTPGNRGIELVCMVGDRRFALEHTIIEPFEDNQRDNIAFERVFDDAVEGDVAQLLKPYLAYTATVDVYAFDEKHRKDLVAIRQDLLNWIRGSIPHLPEPTTFAETALYGEPPATPVRIKLACHRSNGLGGRLIAQRFAPPDLEQLRDKRLLKALHDKGPKLRAAKTAGTTTILILENIDIALTNESVVSDAIDRLGRDLPYMPDDIYLVGTYIPSRFYVTQVRVEGRACVAMGTPAKPWDLAADDLAEI